MIHAMEKTTAEKAALSSFGVAAGRSSFPAGRLDSLLNLPEIFTAAEVPASFAELGADAADSLFDRFDTVLCGSVIDPEIARNIPNASLALRREFTAGVEQTITRLSELGYTAASLDLEINYALLDEDVSERALELLKSLTRVLVRNRFTLILPFTLPARGLETPGQLSALLKRTMNPWFKVRLDVHPHDLKPNFDPAALSGLLPLETAAVHFVYNRDSGNVLVPAHAAPWIDFLYRYGFRGPYMVSPVSLNPAAPLEAAEPFAQIASQIRTSKGK